MNEELKNEAIRLLIDTLKETKDFVGGQIPSVFEQMIRWQYLNTAIDVAFISVCGIFLYFGIKWLYMKDEGGDYKRESEGRAMGVAGFVIVTSLLLILLFCSLSYSIKAFLTPKIYLIDKILEMAKPSESK